MNDENPLEQAQYKEALLKYAHAYTLKKQKNKSEKQLSDSKRYYVIYARKSTEDDKRQVQSIEDQIEQCQKFAKRENLEVVDIVQEDKSAKTAGRRPKFAAMLERLRKGDLYNSILAWHPDRLARNMKESGEILDLLDNDIIVDLKFPSYSFNNDAAGKMTLSILFAMAKEFSDKLSEDTKRGIRKKIREGKYSGTGKRGYMVNKHEYFRPDDSNFAIYQKAWQEYSSGKTQSEIIRGLKEQGEKISTNGMSEYFQDPFVAGIYTYGEQVVDLEKVDPKFTPMIGPKEFLMAQKINRPNPRGWCMNDEFKPLNDLVLCADCGNPMIAGLSEGNRYRYLNLTCSNRACKEKRREKKIKPVSNTIRAFEIIDFARRVFDELLNIDQATYDKAKKKYFTERSAVIKGLVAESAKLKASKSKLETKSSKLSDQILEKHSEDVKQKFSEEFTSVLAQIRNIDASLVTLEQKKRDLEFEIEDEFPDFKTFLNFFENISATIESTDNAYLVDQLVKLVFLNLTVSEKKVVKYTLREPFKTYENLNFLVGVVDRT
ncbi:MAG: recombinase family protein [Candidatus Dojkabacteria bacterium]|nr:MAG: recombinase family protein [Candidatus Dojkabacteria bacterium]